MPKKTFFNLPNTKRDKIIECAKKEFSEYSFYDASINRIIKEAGIARGSFYQYFENKEDLFIYLLDEFKNNMIKAIKNKIRNKSYDIFEIQLLTFDYITNEGMKSKDRDFIISFISNIDIKFANYLDAFIGLDGMQISEFLLDENNIYNIRIRTHKELIAIHNIVITSLTKQLVAYFLKSKDLESCREELIIIFNIIKYGIIKS